MDYARSEKAGIEVRLVEALRPGPSSRAGLCRTLGVSRPVLSRALAPLLEDGTVQSAPGRTSSARGRGRPADVLSLSRDVAHGIGMDVTRSRATGVVLDRAGAVLARASVPGCGYADPRPVVEALCRRLAAEASGAGLRTGYVAHVGVGLPLPVGDEVWVRRHEGGGVVDEIQRLVHEHWAAPVLVDNSVRMAALGEARWGAGARTRGQVYVRLSTGVGGCVSMADVVTGGDTGYAGELGHVRVAGRSTPCQCGKHGCLETVASVPAVLDAAGQADLDALRAALDSPAAPGHARAWSAVRAAAEAVADLCAALVLVLSPTTVVLAGELPRVVPETIALVRERVHEELVPGLGWRVEVTASRLGQDAYAQGAAAAAAAYVARLRATESLTHHQEHPCPVLS